MSHEERIERAQEAASKQLCQCDPCNACVEDIVEAFLGDKVLYEIGEPVGFDWLRAMVDGGALVQVYPEKGADDG